MIESSISGFDLNCTAEDQEQDISSSAINVDLNNVPPSKKTRRKRGNRAIPAKKQSELIQAELKWNKLLQHESHNRFETSNMSIPETDQSDMNLNISEVAAQRFNDQSVIASDITFDKFL